MSDEIDINITQASSSELQSIRALDDATFIQIDRWADNIWTGMLTTEESSVLVASSLSASVAPSTASNGISTTVCPSTAAPILGFIAFERGGKIMKLGVAPTARRQGIGHALLNAALQVFHKGKFRKFALAVSLHVEPTNAPALQLYTAHGFEKDAVVDNYYGPGRPAWRLLLEK